MRQVSHEEFYAAIGPLDVEVRVHGCYHDADYGCLFVLKQSHAVVGRTIMTGDSVHYKPDTNYFLPEK